ncbi:MAG TPA: DUF1116 domain-containing protein [Actinocrinis sp.]|uniref:DUF1116 domain-containing protein n=1 Tax=Actinocrinis sp. TaxID=1920516 RepID=UPI002DDCEC0E|nr:DUF1116 domain-containing protein [Actinocrinis sp.]HEV3169647.1 DUF1116 domain-containing protein [Actinocrinis sp.]
MTLEITRRQVDAANEVALARMLAVQPVWVGVAPLGELFPELPRLALTHAGPPVTWRRMSGAQRGAVIAAVLHEGWAKTPAAATRLAQDGRLTLVPNHDLGGVAPMAGVLSPSMQVFVVEDRASGRRAYSSIEYDSLFGCYDEGALEEIRTWNDVFYPALRRALGAVGSLDLNQLMAQALMMGDELHSRQTAASALLLRRLAPALVRENPRPEAAATLDELAGNELTFLPLAMAAAKLIASAADAVPLSTLVTAMSRNGTEFGIRTSGTGPAWFTAPAPAVQGVYFPGYGPDDAGLDVGDSAITETVGLGAFAMAAAPGIAGLIGRTHRELLAGSAEMSKITAGRNPALAVPQWDFAGAMLGIDIRRVVQTAVLPIIDTATAHREPGHRIIGAGVSRAPAACFIQALEAWFSMNLTDESTVPAAAGWAS